MRLLLAALVLALAGAAPATAQGTGPAPPPSPPPPPPAEPVVADGVTAGGIDLSGLTLDQARVKLRQEIGHTIRKTVTLHRGTETAKLPTKHVAYAFDAFVTARRAVHAEADTAV